MFKEQENWMFVPFLMSFAVLAALLAIQMQNMNGKFQLHNIKTLLPPLEGKTSLMVVQIYRRGTDVWDGRTDLFLLTVKTSVISTA